MHPGWVSFIYFLAALWVSMYTDRARQVILTPIRIPIFGLVRYMDRDLENQIKVLKYMHTDAFHLVHYLAFYILHSIFFVLRWAIILSVAIVIFGHHGQWAQFSISFYGMTLGGLVGRLMRLQLTLSYLFDYNKSIAKLEALRDKYRREDVAHI